jgi:CBS-domain-containing membrane protein
MKGGHAKAPGVPSPRHILLTWLGGCFAIAVLAYITKISGYPLMLGSFGASCVLIFGFPESPFSQPRNVVGGHFLSSLTGLVFITFLGVHWWAMALALATAIVVMQVTRTVHPPAGSNPIIIMLAHATWPFLLTPTLFGVLILLASALIFHGAVKGRHYPQYWL